MSLPLSEAPVRVGRQEPRIAWLPPVHNPEESEDRANQMIDLAALAGLYLDPWQQIATEGATRVRDDGKWAATRVAIAQQRQCGKGSILEARQLAGLFLWGEKLQVHTAHQFVTAQKHFERILSLVESTPALDKRVSRIRRADGEEAIETKSGTKLQFMARSLKSGRGISAEVVYMDEAFALKQAMMASLLPTLSARSQQGNVQIWFTSSAGMPESEVWNDIRDQGIANSDPRLSYMEWSAAEDADPDDINEWYNANAGLGIRIAEDFVRTERGSMGDEEFKRERLGIWAKLGGESFIPEGKWRAGASTDEQTLDKVSIGVDVTPDRSSAVIASAGVNTEGKIVVGLLAHREGTDWVAPYLRELITERGRVGIWLDGTSAASALEPDFKAAGVGKQLIARADYYRACGRFFDLVDRESLVHTDEEALNNAVSAARQGSKGDLWSWSRKDTTADISPLVAATLAVHGVQKRLGVSSSSRSRRSGGRGSFFG